MVQSLRETELRLPPGGLSQTTAPLKLLSNIPAVVYSVRKGMLIPNKTNNSYRILYLGQSNTSRRQTHEQPGSAETSVPALILWDIAPVRESTLYNV